MVTTPNWGTGYEEEPSGTVPDFEPATQPLKPYEPSVPRADWCIWPTLITTRPGLVLTKPTKS